VIDFFTQNDSKVQIKIDGTEYNLPRYLLDKMIKQSTVQRRQIIDEATEKLSDDDRARFITYFQPPPIDVMQMAQWCLSPDGVKVVCDQCMKEGGVPDEVRKSLLEHGDPILLYKLASELTTATRAQAQLKAQNQRGDNPLTQPPRESENSAAAPQPTNAPSGNPTLASTTAA
jgi:hypothetical protein